MLSSMYSPVIKYMGSLPVSVCCTEKEEWLDKLPPLPRGGEMIATVSFEKTTFNELLFKFEAGNPDYIGSTALAEALRYVNRLGMDNIAVYEDELLRYATDKLNAIEGDAYFRAG